MTCYRGNESFVFRAPLHQYKWNCIAQVGMIFPLQAGSGPQCCSRQERPIAGHRLEELLPVLDQSGVQYMAKQKNSVTVLGISKHSKECNRRSQYHSRFSGKSVLINHPIQLCFIADAVGEDATVEALFGLNYLRRTPKWRSFPLILRPLWSIKNNRNRNWWYSGSPS